MPRSFLHALIAIVWAFLAPFVSLRYLESAASTADISVWMVRVLSAFAFSALGVAVLLWSWLKHDAVAHGKPRGMVMAYTLASIPSCGLAMVVYFFVTRERRAATLASLQFLGICLMMMAAVMAAVP